MRTVEINQNPTSCAKNTLKTQNVFLALFNEVLLCKLYMIYDYFWFFGQKCALA